MKQLKFMSILMLGILFITGSTLQGIAKYQALPLQPLTTTPTIKDSITFDYKLFERCTCRKYLGRDLIMKRHKYQPIQVSIINNSNQRFTLSLNDFSLSLISYQEMAELVHFDTGARVFGWGIPGLFLWLLLIPAAIEAVESPKANQHMMRDYAQKSFDKLIIEPYSTNNQVLFVSQK